MKLLHRSCASKVQKSSKRLSFASTIERVLHRFENRTSRIDWPLCSNRILHSDERRVDDKAEGADKDGKI